MNVQAVVDNNKVCEENMFVVKNFKNGNWDSISLIDEDGHFRGEARFESEHEAQKYRVLQGKD